MTEYNIDPKTRIRMVCQSCGQDDNQTKAWRTHYGGPVCLHCCWNCEHLFKFSGLNTCKYKTPAQRRREAAKRNEQAYLAELHRINEKIEAKRKKRAQEYAIKMAKKRRKEAHRKAAEEGT